MAEAVARALMYSGRRDPSWPIDPTVAGELIQIWEGLEPLEDQVPSVGRLGYRGVIVVGLEGCDFLAVDGVVLETCDAARRTRADPRRQFERRVLSSAPSNAIDLRHIPPFK
jgi:hypothetical protein